MSSMTVPAANNNSNNATNTNNIINLHHFCPMEVPDFTPLGGSRPDAAVVACVAVWEEEAPEVKEDVILPRDVLDTTSRDAVKNEKM